MLLIQQQQQTVRMNSNRLFEHFFICLELDSFVQYSIFISPRLSNPVSGVPLSQNNPSHNPLTPIPHHPTLSSYRSASAPRSSFEDAAAAAAALLAPPSANGETGDMTAKTVR